MVNVFALDKTDPNLLFCKVIGRYIKVIREKLDEIRIGKDVRTIKKAGIK